MHNRRGLDFTAGGDFQQQLKKREQHAPHPAALNNRLACLLVCLLSCLLARWLVARSVASLLAWWLACWFACLLGATRKIVKWLLKFLACCIECGEEGQACPKHDLRQCLYPGLKPCLKVSRMHMNKTAKLDIFQKVAATNIATVNALDKAKEKLLAGEPLSLQLRHQRRMWPTRMSLSFRLMK